LGKNKNQDFEQKMGGGGDAAKSQKQKHGKRHQEKNLKTPTKG